MKKSVFVLRTAPEGSWLA